MSLATRFRNRRRLSSKCVRPVVDVPLNRPPITGSISPDLARGYRCRPRTALEKIYGVIQMPDPRRLMCHLPKTDIYPPRAPMVKGGVLWRYKVYKYLR